MLVVLVVLIFYCVCYNPSIFFNSIIDTLYIWLMKVFPSLFTFYLISSLLINFKILDKLSFFFKPIKKILRLKFQTNEAFNLFILSMFSGNPSTVLFINQNQDYITSFDALTLLKCASFVSPIFIISFFSFDLKLAYILIFSHFFSNIIYCMFLTRNNKCIINKSNVKENDSFNNISNFLNSIKECMNILLMIASMMCLCNIIKYSITTLLNAIGLKSNLCKIFLSFFEISTGLNDLISLNLNKLPFALLSSFLLGFGGLCIHLQVKNVMNSNLKFSSFFFARLIHGSISTLITFAILIL